MSSNEKSLAVLQKRLVRLQAGIAELFPLMRGSVVRIGTKIKRPTYSLNLKGKTQIVYLGETKEPIVQAWIENYRKLQEIIDEMTLINIEVIKLMDQSVKKRKSAKK